MRVHCLQHVSFEGIGAIRNWVWAQGHTLSGTELFRTPTPAFPAPADFDFLVIMGGPMNIYETHRFPWLEQEKDFIGEAIGSGKAVLGICLGAQLVADVLGGPVSRGAHREIGWWPVRLTSAGASVPAFADFPDTFTVLHWHGDTFAIPPEAVHAASSEACSNQAFAVDQGRVVGLQFHLEETKTSLAALVENAAGEIGAAPSEKWVATRQALLHPNAPYEACRGLLFALLDRMASGPASGADHGPRPGRAKRSQEGEASEAKPWK